MNPHSTSSRFMFHLRRFDRTGRWLHAKVEAVGQAKGSPDESKTLCHRHGRVHALYTASYCHINTPKPSHQRRTLAIHSFHPKIVATQHTHTHTPKSRLFVLLSSPAPAPSTAPKCHVYDASPPPTPPPAVEGGGSLVFGPVHKRHRGPAETRDASARRRL